jgi:hypothetical protein
VPHVLILGAGSDIARAIARKYAENGHSLYLALRRPEEIGPDVTDLKIRCRVDVRSVEFDVTDFSSHNGFYDSLDPKPEGVICVVGYMGGQEKSQSDFGEAKRVIETNYTGCVSVLEAVAADFEARKEGFIIGISSVAGDRGRASNYMYGSAKAGFSAFLSGLRNRLYKSGVRVLTVKPGFVLTKVTEQMDLPRKLTATPQEVADDIFRAHKKGKNVLYTKWFWKFIMWAIIHIPETLFKRMRI